MEPRAASEGVGGKTDLTETLEMASLSSESGILRSYIYINEWVSRLRHQFIATKSTVRLFFSLVID